MAKRFDWVLFAAIAMLISFGLVEIYSVALGQGGSSMNNFRKQLIAAAVGLAVFFLASLIDYRALKTYNSYVFIAGALLLSAVLAAGITVRGTRGWFYIGAYGFQPVEIAKIILIIVLARLFSEHAFAARPRKYLFLSIATAGTLVGLVLAQPDFGSAMILVLLAFAMAAVAGFDRKYYLAMGLIVLTAGVLAWTLYLAPYQKQRIMTFLDPTFDPLHQGYNIAQAIIAVGAGRMFGRGIGFGSQSQLKFLPEAQNDFIFAVIAEELGFLGVILLVTFFLVIFFRAVRHVARIKDPFGSFILVGAMSLIFIEMFINIGMNIGMLPVVGISLPFVSYGGSALVSSLALLGIVESVIIRSKERDAV